MTKKRIITIFVCLSVATAMLLAVSVFALSPVRCTGGYAGETTSTHRYGFLNLQSHAVYSYSHTVDRVYSGHVYEVIGHTKDKCGHPELCYNLDPGCVGTIVGEG